MSATTSLQPCFQFKASFSPCTILQMARYDLEELTRQLAQSIAQAPQFFLGSPVVVDIERINSVENIDFLKLKEILINAGLVPVGLRGGSPEHIAKAAIVGLPQVVIGKTGTTTEIKKSESKILASKLITSPIRSGMQVYARDTDLIVAAQVSPGAELLADGHIHVYGTLRGRALAGVQGNTQARIFCRTLEAELVSIAGYYLTKEDIQTLPVHTETIQIYLDGEQIKIEAI